MAFSIFFQYSYVPKPLVLLGLFNMPINIIPIINQYSFNTFLFSLDLFFPLFFFIPLSNLYYNSEKTMKKQPKKARKTTDFNPKLDKNEGSVAKLYYDTDGGMRVGGGVLANV